MRADIRSKVNDFGVALDQLVVVDAEGQKMDLVFALDTDERWYEEYVTTNTGKIAVVNGGLLTRRVEEAVFDVVHRDTGEVLAESR